MRAMKVIVLHDQVPAEGAGPDQKDVLVQAEAVCMALRELGHEFATLPVSLDLRTLREQITRGNPDLVFNLVESVEGHGRLIHLPPALLDCMDIPYTGATADAIYETSNKLVAKRILGGTGISTPPYLTESCDPAPPHWKPGPYIIKSVWEHASQGLDEGSVVRATAPGQLRGELQRRAAVLGGECFAEAYIDGREFNLSLLGAKAAPQVLPPAEIRFEGFPQERTRIVGYRAKWDQSSFEYLHTVRSFEFPSRDGPLLGRLAELALGCWSLFRLHGYARVDFRVDAEGTPWVLEINVNPCLSPDAGFAAAADRAGLSFTELVERIVLDCRVSQEGRGE